MFAWKFAIINSDRRQVHLGGGMDCVTASNAGVAGYSPTRKG